MKVPFGEASGQDHTDLGLSAIRGYQKYIKDNVWVTSPDKFKDLYEVLDERRAKLVNEEINNSGSASRKKIYHYIKDIFIDGSCVGHSDHEARAKCLHPDQLKFWAGRLNTSEETIRKFIKDQPMAFFESAAKIERSR